MLKYEKQRQMLLVHIGCDLDHSACLQMKDKLDELLKDGSVRRLVFDMSDVDFMDSSGVGFIIGRYKLMAKRGGTVAVINADARMNRIFEMSGLYQIVERMA